MRRVLEWSVGAVVLALVLRTWFVLGLVEPVTVAGDSMVPALAAGEQLIVDRRQGTPDRWDPVVFVNPADGGQLAVKRVVGLPGETISLRHGDVWRGNELMRKSPTTQRQMRILVHQESSIDRRWHPSDDGPWQWSRRGWHVDATPGEAAEWLTYRHPRGEPITDDLEQNAGIVRQLFPVRDYFLSARLQTAREGELKLRVRAGSSEVETGVAVSQGAALVEFSNFDRYAWLALNGRIVWKQALQSDDSAVGTSSTISLGVRDCELSIAELAIYRDVYYLSAEEAAGYRADFPVYRVGSGQILVLGDNVAVSIDSRHWGPLPLKYVVGRVIFPR